MKATAIDHDVPPPVGPSPFERKRYPFPDMKPLDSIVLDGQGANAFRNWAFRYKWGATTRKVGEDRYRCWRLS